MIEAGCTFQESCWLETQLDEVRQQHGENDYDGMSKEELGNYGHLPYTLNWQTWTLVEWTALLLEIFSLDLCRSTGDG
jgi:hypothetical protein